MSVTLKRRIEDLEKRFGGGRCDIAAEFHRYLHRIFAEPLTDEELAAEEEAMDAKFEKWRGSG